jgi:hypothetical protein
MARTTGLEPATSGVTGRRSNQLSYAPARRGRHIGTGPETVNDSARPILATPSNSSRVQPEPAADVTTRPLPDLRRSLSSAPRAGVAQR